MDLEPHCKSCAKEKRKKYYPSQYAANKRYQAKARKTLNAKRKERYHQNINFKLSMNLGNRIRKVLEGISKSKRTIELLGCSIEDFKKHIESKFLPGMSWDNHSYRGWHIDHILPCASFDLSDPAQQAKCFHYTNLQPLWMADNISKGDSVPTSLDRTDSDHSGL